MSPEPVRPEWHPGPPAVARRPDTALAPAAAPWPADRPTALDRFLVLIVCALAFLLSSTPARNSDLWLHLASGRTLAEGLSFDGTDPFASTTAGVFWANHAWLSDLALYHLYRLGGGRALVLAKAILVTALAALFFTFRRKGTPAGTAALAATAAVLAMGPWLLVQPLLLSLLGLVLALWLLEGPGLVSEQGMDRARSRQWLLVPLFAVWANLDGWFMLGPVLVALYALGEGLRRLPGGRGGDPGRFVLLTTAGLAACLLTPYHYRIFILPTPLGLTHAEQVWMLDPGGATLVVAPFAARFATPPAFGSPGGWAYCLLLVSGALSFLLCGRSLHPGRLLAWLALAALSLYQARAIPFFAVVAGPVLALNLQAIAWRSESFRRSRSLARVAGGLAGVVLLVLAWPGWLQPTPYRPRAWALEPDESVRRLSRHLAAAPANSASKPPRSLLTFCPDAANYLAWACPVERSFLDARWPLFDRVADDFVRMRRCLLAADGGPDPELGPLLAAHHIDRVLVYDPDAERTSQAFRNLLQGGPDWELLAVEGDAALFGYRPNAPSPAPWSPMDYRQAAYQPDGEHRASLTAPPPAAPPGPLDAFYRTRDFRSADRAEASLHLMYFDLRAGDRRVDLTRQWLAAQAVGLLAVATGGEPAAAGTLALRLELTPLLPAANAAPAGDAVAGQLAASFFAAQDRGPSEALWPAVRAARRALAERADDAGAYLLLGEAYLRLARQTREQAWQELLPTLGEIRQTQVLTALEQAVLFRPDLDRAHALLSQLYYESGQMDRALDHLHARLRIAEQAAKQRGPAAQLAGERLSALQSDAAALEALVRRSEQIYQANTEGKTDPSQVLDRARLAARHGLSRKALEMLLASDPAIFGKAGARMQLDLMRQAGRAVEIRAWLEPGHEAALGFATYHWLQSQTAAACGDYAAADAELDRLAEEVRLVRTSPEQLLPPRTAGTIRAVNALSTRPVGGTGPAGLAGALFLQFEAVRPMGDLVALLRQEADLRVLRGLLALEAGAVEPAREHFREALTTWGTDGRPAPGAGVDFLARPIAQQLLPLLNDGRRSPDPRAR